MEQTKRVILIDGDVLVYAFAHRCQQVQRWHRDLWTMFARMDQARAELDDFIGKLADDLGATETRMCLSDLEGNFRLKVLPTYKGNRAGVVRPILFKPIREYLLTKHNATVWKNLEGDDVLGVTATNPWWKHNEPDTEVVICSIDKDLQTVPGLLYDWNHPERGVRDISPADAARHHFYQTLVGDRTDGYPGCPGVGEVGAGKILDAFDDVEWTVDHRPMWEAIVKAYTKKGLTEADALVNARCARILWHEDYDFKTGEVTLWTPPQEG